MVSATTIGVVGVGTIGLPIAYHFGSHYPVIGFDIDATRISELKDNFDTHQMYNSQELTDCKILFTNQEIELNKANFYIVAVPTRFDGKPDLSNLISASQLLGKHLKKGDIVVYESTVYPGVTEEECIPILEKVSGLKSERDFGVGYSPERINPGDRAHDLLSVKKIVSGQNQAILDKIEQVYNKVIEAGVVPVSSIKVAEATKIIENTQRDVQISFLNEAALLLHRMGINSKEVFDAMSTKWNYIPFKPGLVGGSCIGKDSNYLIYKSLLEGYFPNVIISARQINDSIGRFIADQTIKIMLGKNINLVTARIGICGITFKEDYNDTENSKVLDIINELKCFNANILVNDPIADPDKVKEHYDITLIPWGEMQHLDAIIFAVAHTEYLKLTKEDILKKLNKEAAIIDVKCIFNEMDFSKDKGIIYWQL